MANQHNSPVEQVFSTYKAQAVRFADLTPQAQKVLLEVYAKLIEAGRQYLAQQAQTTSAHFDLE